MCKQTSDGVIPEEDPISLKKAKLDSVHWEAAPYWANCLPGREPFKRDAVDLAQEQLKERAGVFVSTSLTLSAAPQRVGGVI